MVQASTSAALTADTVTAGMVLASEMAAEMVTTAASIAIAGAINLMDRAFIFKPKGAGATEPPPMPMTRPPLRGAFF
jgi:hypothetical protein